MFTEGFDQWMKMNRNLAMPMTEWNKTMMDIFYQTAQQQAKIMSDQLARLSDQFDRLSTVKNAEDFFAFQREALNENISNSMECMQVMVQNNISYMEQMSKLVMPHMQTANKQQSNQQAGSQQRHPEKEKMHK